MPYFHFVPAIKIWKDYIKGVYRWRWKNLRSTWNSDGEKIPLIQLKDFSKPPNWKIFKSQPSLLFKTKNKSNNTPYFGKNIFLEFAIPCTIIDGGKNLEENFTILSCISEDKEIKKIFLEVCETTFSDISENPSEEEILKITQSIIDLFKNLPDAKKGFIGLWGELFLITSLIFS